MKNSLTTLVTAGRVIPMETFTYFLPQFRLKSDDEWTPVRVAQGGSHVPFAIVPGLFETEKMARDYVADLDRSANGIFTECTSEWRFVPVEIPAPHQWPSL